MKLITADFETYYSSQFSLTKLTTEAYIRSPEFEAIGVAIKEDDGPTRWYPQPKVKEALAAIDWSQTFLLAQNTAFDAAILAWHYDIHPKALLDTLGMSRALFPHEKSHSLASQAQRTQIGTKGEEVVHALGKRFKDFDTEALARYGQYCCNDVELTYALFRKYIAMGFPQQELLLIDLTLRMFTQPVLRLDASLLIEHLQEVQDRKAALLESVSGAASLEEVRTELMSNEKFATMLQAQGVDPPRKISPATGKETYAFAKTDEAFIALQEHEDDRVQALVAARLGTKSTLEETRTERFIEMCGRGAFPVPLRYYGAHSGRWSGCLVADTQVIVYDPSVGVIEKRIVDVLVDDLVWDGEEFVEHEGVKFSGYQEVVSWDGITGTAEHVVFTDSGEIGLRAAMQGGHRIQAARMPTKNDVDAARRLAAFDQGTASVPLPMR